tara:strand:- start:184 stop:441 length:258 start_codon:yes stop_codon:yes gene_type:complete
MLKLVAELLGSFIFVLVVLKVGKAVPIAITLAAAIYAFGNISGGHFNPAISLTMYFNQTLPFQSLLGYIAAQCLGGVAACYFNRL